MKLKVLNLNYENVGDVEINNNIFAVEPKESILNLVVNWQKAKKQAGTHQVKGRSDVSGTTKKPHRQKGTGKARLGSLRAAQCRGGGIVFGPQARDHSFDVPKKVRKLALKMALSLKFQTEKVHFIDNAMQEKISTKDLQDKLEKFSSKSLLIIVTPNSCNDNFLKSVANIAHVNLLPQIGANVYDLLKHENVIITSDAAKTLEERLK